MAGSFLPQNALGYFKELRNAGQTLGILVIGEQGSGKTSLVNNLLGEEIAKEEEEDTSAISTFKGMVQGVSVTVYEVSGLSAEIEQHQREVQELILSGSITFILYCFKMSETRMRQSLTDAFKMFHSAGVNWNRTVIALTFADSLPVPQPMRRDRNFDEKQHFITRVKEWKDQVHRVLTSEVGVPMETARLIAMLPTTGDPDELLPTGEKWCSTFWFAMLVPPTQTDAQSRMAMNLHGTTDNKPPYSGQQLILAAGVVAVTVPVVGAFALGGTILSGVSAIAGTAIIGAGVITKWKGLW